MKTYSTPQRSQALSPEDVSAVRAKVEEWLDGQIRSGEFESSWTGAVSIVGGGFPGVNSSEELAAVLFG